MSDIIVYENGEIELKISIDRDTIWLTQKQIAELFDKNQSVISRHINNIFDDGEVDKKSNMQKMHNAFSDKPINLYSLDIILAVGYRTNSSKAIKFRQWSTSVLKNYITNGYMINSDKITNDRFMSLEKDVNVLKDTVKTLVNKNITPSQGIFYNGQIFEAYSFVSDIIKSAKNHITIIDNYYDDTVLILLLKNTKVKINIITSKISKEFQLDIKKYNSQYDNLEVTISKKYHDRFIIIDDNDTYHIGASLKDLGKKVFAFSKMNKNTLKL